MSIRRLSVILGVALVLGFGCSTVQDAVDDDLPGDSDEVADSVSSDDEANDEAADQADDDDDDGVRDRVRDTADSADESFTHEQEMTLTSCQSSSESALSHAQDLQEFEEGMSVAREREAGQKIQRVESFEQNCIEGDDADQIRMMPGYAEVKENHERARSLVDEFRAERGPTEREEREAVAYGGQAGNAANERASLVVDAIHAPPGQHAPPVENAPEHLQCKGAHRYDSHNIEHQFHILYCPNDQMAADVEQNDGRIAEGVIGAAMERLQDTIETIGQDHRERWRVSYVHHCSTLMQNQSSPGPYTTLTCKWYADHMDLDRLAEQESWMSAELEEHIREWLQEDRQVIERAARQHFPADDAEREREVFYDLREQAWQDYVQDRQDNAEYYEVVESFEDDIQAGDIAGCEQSLRSELEEYMGTLGATDRQSVIDHISAPVGYALTESLARCHWHHDRDFEAGVYLRLLQDERREVTFGERVYFNQIEEIRHDQQEAERMPHLVGEELLEISPRDIDTPSVQVLDEVAQEWQRSVTGLANDIAFHDDDIHRVDTSGAGVTYRFKERDVRVPVRECEKTDRIDRIRRDGTVVYEQECEIVEWQDATEQTPAFTADDHHGLQSGDWVKFAYDTGDHDNQMGYIGATSDEPDARVKQILDLGVD